MERVEKFYLVAMAIVGWLAVLLQIALVVKTFTSSGQSALGAVIQALSYFTVLTNLMVAIVVTVKAARGGSESFLTRPSAMSAVAVYIFVVGLIYSLLLRALWDPTGLQKTADVALHDFMPILYVLYWFAFVPKGSLRWGQPVRWLIYPLGYVAYSLVRGALTGVYPYHFADVNAIGYPAVLLNTVMLLGGFVILGAIAVAVNRLGSPRHTG